MSYVSMGSFVITKDHLKEHDGQEGRGWPFQIGAAKPKGWHPIELYDDDKELYFEGYADDSEEDGYLDAWEWGAWYAGCTILMSEGEYIIA